MNCAEKLLRIFFFLTEKKLECISRHLIPKLAPRRNGKNKQNILLRKTRTDVRAKIDNIEK